MDDSGTIHDRPGGSPPPGRRGIGGWLRSPELSSALLAIALHARTIGFGFVWDDHQLIVDDPRLRKLGALLAALGRDFWSVGGIEGSGFWRPLVTVSLALDGWTGGGSPWTFHLTNVLLAAVGAALVATFARALSPARGVAFAAGAVFATLPAHVESVAWISGRTDLLATAFVLVALGLDARARHRTSAWPGLAPCAALAAALLAKESALPFVGLVAIAAWTGAAGPPRRGAALAHWLAPYAAITLLWWLARTAILPAAGPPTFLPAEFVARARLAGWLVFPALLAQFPWYALHTPALSLPIPAGAWDPRLLAAIALHGVAAAALAWLVLRRARAALPFAILWLGTVPPMLANLAGLAVFGERFLDLPSAGFALIAGLGVGMARTQRARVLAAGLLACWLLPSAIASWHAQEKWRDDESLFVSMTRDAPEREQGWLLLARFEARAGREAEAREALARLPAGAERRPEALGVRLSLALRRGEWREGLALADTLVALLPASIEARHARAVALLRLGRLDEAESAIGWLRGALGDRPEVFAIEGQWQLSSHRPRAALVALERATREIVSDPELWYALGVAAAEAGDVARARAAFAHATRTDSLFYDAWLRLAVGCRLAGDDAGCVRALARAEALPDAVDGRAAQLRARFAAPSP